MKKNTPTQLPDLSIAIQHPDEGQEKQARLLAKQLGIPIANENEHFDFILRCTKDGLELSHTINPSITGSIRAEFVRGASGYRRVHGGSEILIRAIGHKKNIKTRVLDATGGLGRDAFIMASHGCDVHIAEKNPVIAALLQDGLLRAQLDEKTKKITERITLTIGDSRDYLLKEPDETHETRFDVIYLDPMFPPRNKAAKVKKELQILQLLVGDDESAEDLFLTAMQKAAKRVVVKRPKSAPHLHKGKPSYSLTGKAIRFDVYLATSKQAEFVY